MPRTPRLLAVVVLAAGLAVPGVASATADGARAMRSAAQAAPGEIAWGPCPEDATAECGALRVPVDWAEPAGATVDVAVARRRATDPTARIGSLLINPGGPGSSGVDFAVFGSRAFGTEITRRFDIVGFDPRGVARSHPVRCSMTLLGQAPPPVPASQADLDALRAYNVRLAADCRQRTGPLFDHVDTLSVVRDVDALRAALGEERLSFYGISYGSLIGQQYAEQFPRRVRAIVSDSNMDHSADTRRFLTETAGTVQGAFERFADGCAADRACGLYGRDIRALWQALLAKADRGELLDPYAPGEPLSAYRLVTAAYGSFYAPDWKGLATYLALVESGETPGGGVGVGPPAAQAARSATRAGFAGRVGDDEFEYAFPAVFCEDWGLPVRDYREFAALAGAMAYRAPDMRYSPLGLTAVTACLGWPSEVNNPQHRLRVRGPGTLLVLNPLYDPATPHAWAVRVARQLGPRGALATYDGSGHGTLRRGPCVQAIIEAYLIRGVTPPVGTHCPDVTPTPATARAAADAARSARPAAVGPELPLPRGPRTGLPGW
ncbi:MAG TPA: alpha/beta hydrolase [Pilimelia sp.]|nr:alpha/beta hydrolase [Pilimelia sp.]